jgi:hypothetical protein
LLKSLEMKTINFQWMTWRHYDKTCRGMTMSQGKAVPADAMEAFLSSASYHSWRHPSTHWVQDCICPKISLDKCTGTTTPLMYRTVSSTWICSTGKTFI